MCQSEKHVFLWRSFRGVRANQGLDNIIKTLIGSYSFKAPPQEDMFLTLTHYLDPDWLLLL
jgi:hypothetical protein